MTTAKIDSALLKKAITNPMNLYISTCRYIVEANPYDVETWKELHTYLPYLRRGLSCCVCARILCDPVGPPDGVCGHHVCRACAGGRMRLRPACAWCREHALFIADSALSIVIRCFSKICEYLLASPIAVILADTTATSGDAVDDAASRLLAVIHEGVAAGSERADGGPADEARIPPTLLPQASSSGTCDQNGEAEQSDDVSGDVIDEADISTHADRQVDANGDTVTSEHDYDSQLASRPRKRTYSQQSDSGGGADSRKTTKLRPGCRCGQATQKPGTLTCRGQRCPCYSAFRGCVNCGCRGCRNPRGDPRMTPVSSTVTSDTSGLQRQYQQDFDSDVTN